MDNLLAISTHNFKNNFILNFYDNYLWANIIQYFRRYSLAVGAKFLADYIAANVKFARMNWRYICGTLHIYTCITRLKLRLKSQITMHDGGNNSRLAIPAVFVTQNLIFLYITLIQSYTIAPETLQFLKRCVLHYYKSSIDQK